MTETLFQQIERDGAVLNLSSRCRFKLSGADRLRYLNGQVTNDVRLARADAALYALVTDVKAHIIADIHIHATEDALWLDAEGSLRETLAARLERYIIADDALLEDVTDHFQLWHSFGPAATSLTHAGRALSSSRLRVPGVDLWLPAASQLPVETAPGESENIFETLRILRGIPRYPAELNDSTFPSEAGLESIAVSFTKGCYIGQEVISRIRTTGKMPRSLVLWTAEAGSSPRPGMTLAPPEAPEKPIGIITSAAVHPVTGHTSGLAFIRQGSAQVDSRLLAGSEPPTLAATVKLSGIAS